MISDPLVMSKSTLLCPPLNWQHIQCDQSLRLMAACIGFNRGVQMEEIIED